ncbi:hypothetical protein SDJN02_01371, partial [Cucurbita argyrosperma subsp. argyrosperma]
MRFCVRGHTPSLPRAGRVSVPKYKIAIRQSSPDYKLKKAGISGGNNGALDSGLSSTELEVTLECFYIWFDFIGAAQALLSPGYYFRVSLTLLAAFRTEAKQNHTDQNQEIEAVMGNLNALTLCHDS